MSTSGSSAGNGTLFIGVSTKMYLGYQESLRWLSEVRCIVDDRPGLAAEHSTVRVFVIPSFPVLEPAARILAGSPVLLGAQNCAWGGGPLTGEVSPGMLAELGVSLVEIGHAERRRLFGEDDAVVARKVRAAVDHSLTPLLCIGEPDRLDAGAAAAFCVDQVHAATGGSPTLLRRLVLAYEPVWAIGAQEPAPAQHVNAVLTSIRTALGPGCPIIYGGSAGPGLLPQLPAADGLFLGRFAHDAANLGRVLDEALLLRQAGADAPARSSSRRS
ncbi:triose-phosphate isomerase family protein [Pseudarthrobacter phenanthrenivorans]|jgi:triosephosphate isomerase|uniref:triose-phosphate isomerase family protein n=1 Tax=Micrococcaceae TaxID=1268 RepID=UPI002410266B|nr:triose-phosphate isomerase family protein [Arthrobacter sp. NQ7]MDJ0457340.1 triose-phosphate isomerase [Arthrobacter sp. NQ7]